MPLVQAGQTGSVDTHLGQESQVLLLEELWGRGRGEDSVLRSYWKTREIERWWAKSAGHWPSWLRLERSAGSSVGS